MRAIIYWYIFLVTFGLISLVFANFKRVKNWIKEHVQILIFLLTACQKDQKD